MKTDHVERLDRKRIEIANIVSLLMGFSQSILAYVLSSYFKIASGSENVGTFYMVAYVISLVILLNLHKIVRLIGKANVYYFALIAKIISVTLLIFLDPSRLGIALLMIYLIAVNVEWTTLDVILESYSTDKKSGRIRGLHLTILNAGFLFGPLISAKILDVMSYQGIFFFALVSSALTLAFALPAFRNINHRFEQKLKVAEMIRKVISRKDLLRIYYVSFSLEFFYALMVVYTPLYLLDLGYSWDKIGIIFTIMLVPFVVLQYPMGILADKKFGEKEFLIFSVFLMGISTFMIFFIGAASVAVWASILFITRVGAALVEILRDSYFFKRIDGYDVDMINFFRTAVPMAYILGTMVATLAVFFFSTRFIFLIIAAVVLSALYPAFKLADNKSEKEMAHEQYVLAEERQ